MPEVTKVEFTVEAGIRRVGQLKVLASEIDNHYARLKSETGQTLNFDCTKRPWESSLHIIVEGYTETVNDFLQRIRTSVDRLGLKGVPEHWYD